MATRKRKCPDCGAKLKKGEKKGTKQCPDCLLFIGKDNSIIRYQGESVDEAASQGSGDLQADRPDEGGNQAEGDQGDNPQADQEAGKENIINQPDPDHISRGLMAHPAVTVYAWPIGIQGNRGYRYGIQSPYPDPPWKKKMSGLEAFQFLSNIRNRSRTRKLQSLTLPEMESD